MFKAAVFDLSPGRVRGAVDRTLNCFMKFGTLIAVFVVLSLYFFM
jgi:hypothetical protein